jgi:hypothetical protein
LILARERKLGNANLVQANFKLGDSCKKYQAWKQLENSLTSKVEAARASYRGILYAKRHLFSVCLVFPLPRLFVKTVDDTISLKILFVKTLRLV